MSTRPIKLTVIGQHIEIEDMPPVVAGTEGVYVAQFDFDSCWDGYSKIAVFAAGWRLPVEQLLREDRCSFPPEVLVAGERLRIGVYGIQDGKRLPTVWTSAIPVLPGATAGKPAQEPAPGITEQIIANMGDLDNLETQDKSSLVAAINEARSTGGGGSYAPKLVTITETDGIYLANKSFDEIKAAYDAGRTVIARIGNDRLTLNDCTDLRAYFLKMAASTVQVGLVIESDESVYLGETVFATIEDIPAGGGGGGKKKTVKLLDVTLEETTAKISASLDRDYPTIMLVWHCGETSRLVNADGASTSGYAKLFIDTDVWAYNALNVAKILDDGKAWKTTAVVLRYTDDCSVLLDSLRRDVSVSSNMGNNVFESIGGSTALMGTINTAGITPTAGRTINFCTDKLFNVGTRIILVGEYFE